MPPAPAQMPKSRQIFWVVLMAAALAIDLILPRYWPLPAESGWRAALHFALTNLLYPVMILSFHDNDRYRKPLYNTNFLKWAMLAAYLGMIVLHFTR